MSARCTSVLHGAFDPDRQVDPDRPPAVYQLFAMPCLSSQCEGRICCGHLLCPQCVAEVRSARVVWGSTGGDVEVVLVTSA